MNKTSLELFWLSAYLSIYINTRVDVLIANIAGQFFYAANILVFFATSKHFSQ